MSLWTRLRAALPGGNVTTPTPEPVATPRQAQGRQRTRGGAWLDGPPTPGQASAVARIATRHNLAVPIFTTARQASEWISEMTGRTLEKVPAQAAPEGGGRRSSRPRALPDGPTGSAVMSAYVSDLVDRHRALAREQAAASPARRLEIDRELREVGEQRQRLAADARSALETARALRARLPDWDPQRAELDAVIASSAADWNALRGR